MMLLNQLLGTTVAAIGFWLLWGAVAPAAVLVWIAAVGGFLWWKARTVTEVWAWSTLLLGLESFAWPVLLMVQLKSAAAAPSDDDMGTVLSAVVLGLFSSVFWTSFSYGLFKRASSKEPAEHPADPAPVRPIPEPIKAKKKR
jgi:hypothetical protein